ncbi:MAG TPA: Fic family protein [Methanocorpusculum sp.]|nr:Fic family protein [Methanocorpusculum sp.]
MSSPFELCDTLKMQIARYRMPEEDETAFYNELCREAYAASFNPEREKQLRLLFETAAEPELSLEKILQIHRELFPDAENAGQLRSKRIYIGSSRYPIPMPEVIPPLIEGVIRFYNSGGEPLHPVMFAAAVHHKFAFIYPFSAGTLETAQFLQNLVLVQNGYPPVSIPKAKLPQYRALLDAGRIALDRFSVFIAECVAETEGCLLQALESSDKYVISVSGRTKQPLAEEKPAQTKCRVFLIDKDEAVPSNPVYAQIAARPGIRRAELAQTLAMSPEALARALAGLKKAGMIEFKGQPKTGGYVPTSARPLDDYFTIGEK